MSAPGVTILHVLGESGLANGVEFKIASSGTISICRFRSRDAKQFLLCSDVGARTSVHLESCEATGQSHVDGNAPAPIVLGGWGTSLMLTSCTFEGFIVWDQQRNADGDPLRQGALTMLNTCIRDGTPAAPPNPFRVRNFDNDAENLIHRVLGCSWRNNSAEAGAATDDGYQTRLG